MSRAPRTSWRRQRIRSTLFKPQLLLRARVYWRREFVERENSRPLSLTAHLQEPTGPNDID